MPPSLIIFICGGLGCVARHMTSIWIGRFGTRTGLLAAGFPWGTLGVNFTGAFLIGLMVSLGSLRVPMADPLRLALMTGFLGGFTTFSAFSLETMLMLGRGAYMQAGLYIALSVMGTIMLVFAGAALIRAII